MIITLNKLANTNGSVSFGILVKDRKKNVARPKSYALADGLEVLQWSELAQSARFLKIMTGKCSQINQQKGQCRRLSSGWAI